MKKIILLILFCSAGFFVSPAQSQPDDYRLWESFENYPGNDFFWAPAGWTIQSNAGNVPNPEEAITWHFSDAIGELDITPTNGKYMAYLNGAIGEQQQDEWLISPVFTPETQDFLFFDANYSPFWMFFDYENVMENPEEDFIFNFENPFNSMQALVSTDEGASWTTLWDAGAGNYNEENIWDYLDNQWHKIKISLDDYVGKPVQIAFRLFGKNAQSSAIDYIRAGILIPEASYAIPQGFFYGGINAEGYGAPGTAIGAAYIPTTWCNTSPDATGFHWTLPNIFDAGSYSSTEENPSDSYIYDAFYFPTLTVNFGTAVSEPYSWAAEENTLFGRSVFLAGGNFGESLHALDPSIPEGIGVGNYNLLHNINVIALGPEDYLFGTGPGNRSKAIANYFEKPAQAYLLRGVNIAAYQFKAPAGTELTLTIRRVDANGELKEVIATAQWTTNQAIPETDFFTIPFHHFSIEDLVIDDAIFMELSGFSGKSGLSFGVYSEALQTDGSEGNAYVSMDVNGVDTWLPTSAVLEEGGSTSLCFTLDLVYSFIAPQNLDYDFHATAMGGEAKSFSLISYYARDNKWQENLPEWITSSFSEQKDGTSVYTLTVDELPEGFSYRYDPVILTDGRGGKATFHVSQSAPVGIKKTKTVSQAKIASVNGNFEFSYSPESFSRADLFSISGQKISSYALPASGKLTVAASGFPNGIYIVRFSGKTVVTVKVVN
ncbi:hypothetical protein FACS189474_1440 [Bacteroidia bacterium]|nr:hypothetical protein FACS189474_1440 [Bacteroidia bacterium]